MKKGAIELSIGTIVIIVLAMSMLILGMVLVRSIMCAGVGMTEDIEKKMKSEISALFGARDYGVKCMGAPNQDKPVLADGGRREIYCMIREDKSTEYKLEVAEIKSRDTNIDRWIIHKDGWKGVSGVGEQMERIVELEIPRGVSATTLEIVVNEYRDGSTTITRTHTLRIDVAPLGAMSRTIC